ncbi:MAG TPA: GNAT family N-acetyltransferase [Chitinophagaceae bacterium]|jgi:ribosomal protein S18 acetylase RimI-like enzyme|nr:GNAT family N-acetyltransferase [Chitinophagaceae bacterium]
MIIRKATVHDAEPIAACLLLAMEDIVYRFIGERDPEKAKAFLLHFAEQENNQYSFRNCWVAEADGEVVAAVNIYDGAQLHALRQPVLDYLETRFARHLEPEDETGAGEIYIDSLGVRPEHQGRGRGTGLLQFLVYEYVQRQKAVLGLLVDPENPGARRLYLKLGFRPAGTKQLLGKRLEHLQCKS